MKLPVSLAWLGLSVTLAQAAQAQTPPAPAASGQTPASATTAPTAPLMPAPPGPGLAPTGQPAAPTPTFAPDLRLVPASPAASVERPPDLSTDYRLYAGIGTMILGAGALVMTGIGQSEVLSRGRDEGFIRYRQALQPDQHACEEARAGRVIAGAGSPQSVARLCDDADDWEAFSYVAAPLGLALLGLGGYLVWTSDSVRYDQVSLSLLPRFGPDGGAASATLRF